jgi:hypothetical protein
MPSPWLNETWQRLRGFVGLGPIATRTMKSRVTSRRADAAQESRLRDCCHSDTGSGDRWERAAMLGGWWFAKPCMTMLAVSAGWYARSCSQGCCQAFFLEYLLRSRSADGSGVGVPAGLTRNARGFAVRVTGPDRFLFRANDAVPVVAKC